MSNSVILEQDVEMKLRDGTILRCDVWRPGDGQPHPVIVERTPYGKERAVGTDFLRADRIAKHGYVMVIQDTRGRFASDGEWSGREPLIAIDLENDDTYDTVEWAAEQLWSDGNVALYGVSYPGGLAWRGAVTHPPHLRAIAPAVAPPPGSAGRQSGGAMNVQLALFWLIHQLASDTVPKLRAAGKVSDEVVALVAEGVRNPESLAEIMPLKESPYLSFEGCPVAPSDLFPGHRPPQKRTFDQVAVPVLMVGGWFDVGTPCDQFRALVVESGGGEAVRSEHALVVGPWTHNLHLPEVQGDLSFGRTSLGTVELMPIYLAFFDRHLKGRADSRVPRIRYFHMGPNEWHESDTWPVPGSAPQKWYFAADGVANTVLGDGRLQPDEAPSTLGSSGYTYDPADPVRTYGGHAIFCGTSGPLNQHHIELRDDVLCYTSEPMNEPMDLVGPLKVHLFAASSVTDTDFAAKLTDVYPDGRSILLCEGLRRARYRFGLEEEVFLEPGAVEEYEIDLGDIAWRVDRGHRIRIDVTSSNFPWYDRNMNTGNPVGEDSAGIPAEQTVFHGGAQASYLEAYRL